MLYPQKQVKWWSRNHPPQNFKHQQQGVVIVVALFVVALVAAMSYLMLARLERDTERALLITRDAQANLYAEGSIAWAKDVLNTNIAEEKPNQIVDHIPIKSPVNNMNGYKIVTTIYDMQGRFNVNNLINSDEQIGFIRLLQTVQPNLTMQKAQAITNSITYWISPVSKQAVDDKYYADLTPPYRVAHRPMASISELQLIKGVSPSLYRALEPYIIALPVPTTVNINTASIPLLMSLSPTISLETAKNVDEIRKSTLFTSPIAFTNIESLKSASIDDKRITVISSYFLVETQVSIEKQKLVLYTLLERAKNGDKPVETIIWQSKGIW